jgi:hypothetical protein
MLTTLLALSVNVVMEQLALSSPAEQYPTRTVWVYEGGWVKQNNPPTGSAWTERQWNGSVYNFTFVKSTQEYVLLYDSSRGCSIALYDDRTMVKVGAGTWDQCWTGRWAQ